MVAGLDPAMRMSGIHVGLLLNFNVPRLVDGLHRYVVQPPSKPTASAPWSPCSPHVLRAEKTWSRFAPAVAGGLPGQGSRINGFRDKSVDSCLHAAVGRR